MRNGVQVHRVHVTALTILVSNPRVGHMKEKNVPTYMQMCLMYRIICITLEQSSIVGRHRTIAAGCHDCEKCIISHATMSRTQCMTDDGTSYWMEKALDRIGATLANNPSIFKRQFDEVVILFPVRFRLKIISKLHEYFGLMEVK